MKILVSISALVCLLALAHFNTADGSSRFIETCFETEEKAKGYQKAHRSVEVDNSEVFEKDDKARKLAWRDDVLLSDLKSILGEPDVKVDEIKNLVTYEWSFDHFTKPSVTEILYHESKGYCLNVRRAGMRFITYIWIPEAFGQTRGVLIRHESYI